MTAKKEKEATHIIMKKNVEKEESESVEGLSVEYSKEDSIYYTWNQKYEVTGLFRDTDTLLTENYSTRTSDTRGVLYAPNGGIVNYTVHALWSNISDSTVASFINTYSTNKLKNGDNAITCVQNGNTKYDCFNFAWLKDYRTYEELWKECDFDNDTAFTNSSAYKSSTSAASGWVGSNGIHAVYVVKKEVDYWDESGEGNKHTEPMVKSKWGTGGPLMKHPLSQSPYVISGMTYYTFRTVC